MEWKTTEEIYAELLEAKKEAQEAMNRAFESEEAEKLHARLARENWDIQRWKVKVICELQTELLKRANATKGN